MIELQDGIPQTNLTSRATGQPAGLYMTRRSVVVQYPAPAPGNLEWARWPAFLISGPEIPWFAFITRVDTEGGALPNPIACGGLSYVLVPYKARHVLYSC
jgi:hypothetical protein